jgi:hypothetical protein
LEKGIKQSLVCSILIDECVVEGIAEALRRHGFDAISVQEAHKRGLSNEDLLIYATKEKRAVLTHNIPHFVKLHTEWIKEGKTHYGILVTSEVEFKKLLRKVTKFLNTVASDEAINLLWFI